MTDTEFRAFLDLMMCSDPWPCPETASNAILVDWANNEARRRGFDGWIVAYHDLPHNNQVERPL